MSITALWQGTSTLGPRPTASPWRLPGWAAAGPEVGALLPRLPQASELLGAILACAEWAQIGAIWARAAHIQAAHAQITGVNRRAAGRSCLERTAHAQPLPVHGRNDHWSKNQTIGPPKVEDPYLMALCDTPEPVLDTCWDLFCPNHGLVDLAAMCCTCAL